MSSTERRRWWKKSPIDAQTAGWFIDANAPAGGDGSFSAPFQALTDVIGMETGTTLFVASGTQFWPGGAFTHITDALIVGGLTPGPVNWIHSDVPTVLESTTSAVAHLLYEAETRDGLLYNLSFSPTVRLSRPGAATGRTVFMNRVVLAPNSSSNQDHSLRGHTYIVDSDVHALTFSPTVGGDVRLLQSRFEGRVILTGDYNLTMVRNVLFDEIRANGTGDVDLIANVFRPPLSGGGASLFRLTGGAAHIRFIHNHMARADGWYLIRLESNSDPTTRLEMVNNVFGSPPFGEPRIVLIETAPGPVWPDNWWWSNAMSEQTTNVVGTLGLSADGVVGQPASAFEEINNCDPGVTLCTGGASNTLSSNLVGNDPFAFAPNTASGALAELNGTGTHPGVLGGPAPTTAAGDFYGHCVDFNTPSIGAFSPDP